MHHSSPSALNPAETGNSLRTLAAAALTTPRKPRNCPKHPSTASPTRADSPVRNPTAWMFVAAMSSLFLLLGTLNAYGQVLVGEALGVPVRIASVIMMSFWGANLVASLSISRWSDRIQRRTPFLLAGGSATAAALTILIALLPLGTAAPTLVVVAVFIGLGVALGAVFGPWMAAFAAYVEETHVDAQGTAFGLQHLISRLVVLGAVLLAPRIADAAGWSAWLLVTLAATGAFIALVLALHRRAPERTPEPVEQRSAAG
ncbi:MFS transporter [Saccharopolyspora mangrovi]|nr:MFS transporter [Saccharopolyspora sp. S2-29]